MCLAKIEIFFKNIFASSFFFQKGNSLGNILITMHNFKKKNTIWSPSQLLKESIPWNKSARIKYKKRYCVSKNWNIFQKYFAASNIFFRKIYIVLGNFWITEYVFKKTKLQCDHFRNYPKNPSSEIKMQSQASKKSYCAWPKLKCFCKNIFASPFCFQGEIVWNILMAKYNFKKKHHMITYTVTQRINPLK